MYPVVQMIPPSGPFMNGATKHVSGLTTIPMDFLPRFGFCLPGFGMERPDFCILASTRVHTIFHISEELTAE